MSNQFTIESGAKVLVTGAAGFIGYHLSKRLLEQGTRVVGLDNINDYYDVRLKHARLDQLRADSNFTFERGDIADRDAVAGLFEAHQPDYVVNLAAQAGVRYSIENPAAYIDSNIVGFGNILEGCRHGGVKHLVYASSSSVYGGNTRMPFSVHDNVDHPVSLYAASKKANELMAHTYSHLYALPTTGLRFFTVYGPWGRPDMALYIFTRAILAGKPIQVFNHGKMQRDFTYVDDIVEGVRRLIPTVASANEQWNSDQPDPGTSSAAYRIYNIGNNNPVELEHMIEVLEGALGKRAIRELLPMQPGDVPATYANVEALTDAVGFKPQTSIEDGIGRFIDWYKMFHN